MKKILLGLGALASIGGVVSATSCGGAPKGSTSIKGIGTAFTDIPELSSQDSIDELAKQVVATIADLYHGDKPAEAAKKFTFSAGVTKESFGEAWNKGRLSKKNNHKSWMDIWFLEGSAPKTVAVTDIADGTPTTATDALGGSVYTYGTPALFAAKNLKTLTLGGATFQMVVGPWEYCKSKPYSCKTNPEKVKPFVITVKLSTKFGFIAIKSKPTDTKTDVHFTTQAGAVPFKEMTLTVSLATAEQISKYKKQAGF